MANGEPQQYLYASLSGNAAGDITFTTTTTDAANDCAWTYPAWQPYQVQPQPSPDINEFMRILTEQKAQDALAKKAAPPPQEERKMVRGLFELFVVAPETGDVVIHEFVVADDADKAKLKVARRLADDVDADDYDFIVRRIGDVRAKKTVRQVKVVG